MTELKNIKAAIWQNLELSVSERGHQWRTPVLATIDTAGTPQARTVVLRSVNTAAQQLRIFTDKRSPKVEELLQQPRASLLFWSSSLSWQVRISAQISVITEGEAIDQAWARISKSAAASDYLTFEAPGSPLPAMMRKADSHALAILEAQAEEIDWLEINPGGHRRARLSREKEEWLVP